MKLPMHLNGIPVITPRPLLTEPDGPRGSPQPIIQFKELEPDKERYAHWKAECKREAAKAKPPRKPRKSAVINSSQFLDYLVSQNHLYDRLCPGHYGQRGLIFRDLRRNESHGESSVIICFPLVMTSTKAKRLFAQLVDNIGAFIDGKVNPRISICDNIGFIDNSLRNKALVLVTFDP